MTTVHIPIGQLRARRYSMTSCSLSEAVASIKSGSYEISPNELVLGRKIGEGAMAVVYEAKFRGDRCAAKKLKKGVDQESKQYQDLLVELNVLASVGAHRNLVGFFGACLEDPTSPIVVVELMEGLDLQTYLSRKRIGFNLGHAVVFNWSLDILRALDHLHNRDPMILHRDVKPENLLLSKDRKTLKLTDFGLSKKVSRSESGDTLHRGSTGTFRYMAPEVVGSLSLYTEKADVYSAALVIWYMLTGFKPNIDIRETPEGRPNLAPAKARWVEVADIVERMWQVDANNRPSASECIEAMLAIPNIPMPLSETLPNGAVCCRTS